MSTRNQPISETDLLAKGWKPDGKGAFVWDKLAAVANNAAKAMDQLHKTPMLTKIPKQRPQGLVAIENVLKASRIAFESEMKFHPTREWRFDITIPSLQCAVEYEGIFSEKSRHTGMKGYTEDSNKYNAAQLLGWTVLRYTAKNYKNFIDDLKQLLCQVQQHSK